MIPIPERQQIVHWAAEASAAGARRHKACCWASPRAAYSVGVNAAG